MISSLPPQRMPRHWTIRNTLLALVLACLLPGAIGTAVLMVHIYRDNQAQLESRIIQTARALVQVNDKQLQKLQAVGQTLATSEALTRSDLARFHQLASETLALVAPGMSVVLSDGEQQLVNTLQPFDLPLPRSGNPERLRQVMASGQPTISDLFLGGLQHRPIISVNVPVMRQGKAVYVLSIGLLTEQFNNLLQAQDLPPGWVTAIIDRSGTLVGRSRAAEQFVGQKTSAIVIQAVNASSEGVVESTSKEGVPVLVHYSRSPSTGWMVTVSIPRAEFVAEQGRLLTQLVLGCLALFGLALGLAWFLGGRIAASVKGLVAPAQALGSGAPVTIPHLTIREAAEVAQALAEAGEWLQERTRLTQAKDATDAANAALQHDIDLRD